MLATQVNMHIQLYHLSFQTIEHELIYIHRLLSNNGLNGILDVGNTYNSDLNVDLTNNSILDFNQKSVYNMTLK